MVEMGKNRGSDAKLLDRENDHKVTIAPNWLSTVDDVKVDLARIQQKMDELREAHKKHLLPGFDDRQDEVQAIEILTSEITRLFAQAQGKIKGMSRFPLGAQEKSMRENIQSTLASKLQEYSMDFRKAQKRYLGQLQTLEQGGDPFKITGDDVVMESPLIDPGMSDVQVSAIDDSVAWAVEHERQTRQILQTVTELTDILKDLAMLIVEQGTVLDRIDYNIEHAAHDTEQGLANIIKGEEEQKKTKTKYCISMLCCLILAALLAIILKSFIKAVV